MRASQTDLSSSRPWHYCDSSPFLEIQWPRYYSDPSKLDRKILWKK